jgi:hypothetical protein
MMQVYAKKVAEDSRQADNLVPDVFKRTFTTGMQGMVFQALETSCTMRYKVITDQEAKARALARHTRGGIASQIWGIVWEKVVIFMNQMVIGRVLGMFLGDIVKLAHDSMQKAAVEEIASITHRH